MELICPLCNGMYHFEETCPQCGEIMWDGGIAENYIGPYSPYMEQSYYNAGEAESLYECVHIFTCPRCGLDQRVSIDKVPK